jgi:hypothetical protein
VALKMAFSKTRKITAALEGFFKTYAVLKLLAIIAVCVALIQFARWLPTVQVRRGSLPEIAHAALSESLGEIAASAGETLVARNNGRELYVDPASMNLRVVDTASGLVWNALRVGEGTVEDQSLIRIVFMSEDDVISRWDSYTYSLKTGGYTLEKISNGVRITLHVGNADPTNINAFMPRRIAIERYEDVFLDGLDKKVAAGGLSAEEAGMYKSVLGLVFAKDEENGYYYNKLAASPPGSAVRQLLTMTRVLGYTSAEAVEDEAPYELPAEERRPPAGFFIPVEFALSGGNLTASVSTEHIVVENDYYTLTQIIMLPNFGSVSAAECAEGYLFVPDGSGALIALNSFDANYNGYERPLYYNTVFRDKASLPQYPEDLTLPVFGMSYGGKGGFAAVIEAGDETAFIGMRAGSAQAGSSGAVYNRVYAGFDTTQYQQMSIVGADTNGGSYTVGTGMLDMTFSIRYTLFSKPAGYFDMAQVYKQYLTEKYGLTPDYTYTPKLYFDVTGTVTVEGRFLGKAYERPVSLTEYDELAAILSDLGSSIPKIVAYNGVFNGGVDNKLANRAALVPQNGSRKELDALFETARQTNTDLFMGANLARVYKPSANGYDVRTHAAQGYDSEPAYFGNYDLPSGTRRRRRSLSSWYTQLNPVYLLNVLDGFLRGAVPYENIYVNDLGVDYYANYRRNAIVPPLVGRAVLDDGLRLLSGEKTLALNNPTIDKIAYAAYAVNISRESSNYGGFYTSVPFRQLVLNGLIAYTTLNVNMSEEPAAYYLLQALELGSFPKFQITAKNADTLKYTEHTEFLSTRYETLSGDIKALYERYAGAFAQIGSAEIVNHETLGNRVFVSTYASGVSVTVNYNYFPVNIGDGGNGEIIPALGYVIKGAS